MLVFDVNRFSFPVTSMGLVGSRAFYRKPISFPGRYFYFTDFALRAFELYLVYCVFCYVLFYLLVSVK